MVTYLLPLVNLSNSKTFFEILAKTEWKNIFSKNCITMKIIIKIHLSFFFITHHCILTLFNFKWCTRIPLKCPCISPLYVFKTANQRIWLKTSIQMLNQIYNPGYNVLNTIILYLQESDWVKWNLGRVKIEKIRVSNHAFELFGDNPECSKEFLAIALDRKSVV